MSKANVSSSEARLMVIDDDPAEVFLIRRALSDPKCKLPNGTSIDVQMDGRAALQALETKAKIDQLPHLILLDLNMPGMDGFDVLSHCAGNAKLSGIPKVVITTASEPSMLQRARELGAIAAYTKPHASADTVSLFSKLIAKFLN